MSIKMSLISQNVCVSITLVLVSILCMRSQATVSFYDVDAYARCRFAGLRQYKVFSDILEFGPKFPDPPKGFDGMIVMADPEDGCQSIAPPPNATGINPIGKWIAFMKIGNCDLTVKTRNAQNANYHMALIDNESNFIYRGRTQYDRNANTSDIKINTVVVMSTTGNYIKRWGSYDKRHVLNVMNDERDPVFCYHVPNKKNGTTCTDSLMCKAMETNKNVPIPDTWTV